MFNEIVVVSVTPFSGSDSADKNGIPSVMFQPIAGVIPNLRQVIAGTVAERLGVKIGETYLMRVRESGTDKEFGIDFQWIKIKENLSVMEIIEATEKLGEGRVMVFNKPGSDYIRKTTAVEGQRTLRIKEGLYIPSNATTAIHHESADKIIDGTSITENEDALFPKENRKLNQ